MAGRAKAGKPKPKAHGPVYTAQGGTLKETLDRLSPKHARFVREYLIDLNASAAAVRAGYGSRNPNVTGPRLLANVRIAAAVKAGETVKAEESGITRARVLAETEALAFSNVATHYIVDDFGNVSLAPGAPPNALAAISSIKRRPVLLGTGDKARTGYEVELRLWDKPGTLKLAGRHVGVEGFHDRMEVTGKGGGPVETEVHLYIPDNGRARSDD